VFHELKPLNSYAETGRYLRVSAKTVQRMALQRGELYVGRRPLIPRASILDFERAHTVRVRPGGEPTAREPVRAAVSSSDGIRPRAMPGPMGTRLEMLRRATAA
jgi:hypothetical protein